MKRRQYSMQRYWEEKAAGWKPLLSFQDYKDQDFSGWKEEALAKLLDLLGDFPTAVEPCPEVESSVEDDGLIRERVVFDSEEGMSVPCILLRPIDMAEGKNNPAILCCHGHGAFGKDLVAGIRATPEHEAGIARQRYNYAEQMARAGFVTLSLDLRGFGERKDGIDPFPGRDRCNVNFNKGVLLGLYTMTLNIWDLICCVDYLQQRPEVEPDRIGMMGLSLGGTMTAFTTAVEPRIRAANVCGYGGSWEHFAIGRSNFCGSQIVPNIYRYFDISDILGLIAPRPLLLDMGIYDDNFTISEMLASAAQTEKIYTAAGCSSVLQTDVHPHGHAFGGNKAATFFHTYL